VREHRYSFRDFGLFKYATSLFWCAVFALFNSAKAAEPMDPTPFGAEAPTLDSRPVGEWWTNKKGSPFE
jgi:hypothetical protein